MCCSNIYTRFSMFTPFHGLMFYTWETQEKDTNMDKTSAHIMLQRENNIPSVGSLHHRILMGNIIRIQSVAEKHLMFVSLRFCWTYVSSLALSQGSDTFSTPGRTSQEAAERLFHMNCATESSTIPGCNQPWLVFNQAQICCSMKRKMDGWFKHCPCFLTCLSFVMNRAGLSLITITD